LTALNAGSLFPYVIAADKQWPTSVENDNPQFVESVTNPYVSKCIQLIEKKGEDEMTISNKREYKRRKGVAEDWGGGLTGEEVLRGSMRELGEGFGEVPGRDCLCEGRFLLIIVVGDDKAIELDRSRWGGWRGDEEHIPFDGGFGVISGLGILLSDVRQVDGIVGKCPCPCGLEGDCRKGHHGSWLQRKIYTVGPVYSHTY
jgi:hypothetical protein